MPTRLRRAARPRRPRRGRALLVHPDPDLDLQVAWRGFETPVVSYRGDDPAVYAQRSLFNVLLFAREAEIRANGVRIDGAPYTDGRWRPVIGGGDRSSCVVALAETFITPA